MPQTDCCSCAVMKQRDVVGLQGSRGEAKESEESEEEVFPLQGVESSSEEDEDEEEDQDEEANGNAAVSTGLLPRIHSAAISDGLRCFRLPG